VRANAAAYGGDPGRIVLAGESAGANLVAALATALCWERPEPFAAHAYSVGAAPSAVVAACGVFQVSDVARLVRRKPNMSSFVQDRLYEVEAAYLRDGTPTGDPTLDLADPLVFVERASAPARTLPPFFLPVGTRDPLLPDTRRCAAALRAHGSATEAAYYRGEPHAFHAFVFLPNARRCWEDTWRFLERHAPTQS
jgi:acetyl esterase